MNIANCHWYRLYRFSACEFDELIEQADYVRTSRSLPQKHQLPVDSSSTRRSSAPSFPKRATNLAIRSAENRQTNKNRKILSPEITEDDRKLKWLALKESWKLLPYTRISYLINKFVTFSMFIQIIFIEFFTLQSLTIKV